MRRADWPKAQPCRLANPRAALPPKIIPGRLGVGDRRRAHRFEIAGAGEGRLRADCDQAVAEGEALAPDVVDHRMIGGGAGIGVGDRAVVEQFLGEQVARMERSEIRGQRLRSPKSIMGSSTSPAQSPGSKPRLT